MNILYRRMELFIVISLKCSVICRYLQVLLYQEAVSFFFTEYNIIAL